VRHPGLRVLSLAGYHDVATPFRQTELDLARLGAQPTVFTRVYAGGHMTYLDDTSRPAPQGRHRGVRAGCAPTLAIDSRTADRAARETTSRSADVARAATSTTPALPSTPDHRRAAARARPQRTRPGRRPVVAAGVARSPDGGVAARRRPRGARARQDRRARPRRLPVDVLAAVGLPRALEVARVFLAARPDGHQDAAFADALVVLLDALLGDSPADQRADDAAGRRAGARAGDRRRQRAGDDEPEPGKAIVVPTAAMAAAIAPRLPPIAPPIPAPSAALVPSSVPRRSCCR
jgi:hypothetical protein